MNSKWSRVPVYCIQTKPRPNSVLFCGVHINLSHVAFKTGLTAATLSRIFNAKVTPHYATCRKISSALGINIESFMRALDEHVARLKPYTTTERQRVMNKSTSTPPPAQ